MASLPLSEPQFAASLTLSRDGGTRTMAVSLLFDRILLYHEYHTSLFLSSGGKHSLHIFFLSEMSLLR